MNLPPTAPPPGPDDWLLFACHACGGPLKIRRSNAHARFQCPHCREEVAIPASHAHTISQPPPLQRPRGDVAPPRKPFDPKGLISQENPDAKSVRGELTPQAFEPRPDLAVDPLAAMKFRQFDEPDFAVPEKGLRIKKRKRRSQQASREMEAPTWDDAKEAEAIGEVTAAAPPPAKTDETPKGGAFEWEQITTATVAVTTTDDGRVVERRKRFKRRRNLKGFERANHWIATSARWLLVLFGTGILGGGIYGGYWLLSRRGDVGETPKPLVPQVADYGPRAYALTSEADAAAAVVAQFLAAPTLEDRLRYVRFPEKVKPLMEAWYREKKIVPQAFARETGTEVLTKIVHSGGREFVVLMGEVKQEGPRIFSVEKVSPDVYKLDWETAVGWQPMDLADLKAAKPTRPIPFRLSMNVGDYYNGPFSDPAKWQVVDLTYPGRDFQLFGYIDRSAPWAKPLIDKLITPKAEKEAKLLPPTNTSAPADPSKMLMQKISVIADIAYPPDGRFDNQVLITRVRGEEWFLPDGPAADPEPAVRR